MSQYDNTKFYWLQLKEDFFEEKSIAWLLEQRSNKKDYLEYSYKTGYSNVPIFKTSILFTSSNHL